MTRTKPATNREIQKLEQTIRDAKQKLAALRRKALEHPVDDYRFHGSLGEELRLSQAFGDKDELIVIHNMGRSCPHCTMWADGFNGLLPHLEDRAGFLLESGDEPRVQRKFAADRGWKFRMVSSRGTSFKDDMGFADDDGDPTPGISAFRKSPSGGIFRVASARLGPGDNYCIAWDLFDLLRDDRDWTAKFHY